MLQWDARLQSGASGSWCCIPLTEIIYLRRIKFVGGNLTGPLLSTQEHSRNLARGNQSRDLGSR